MEEREPDVDDVDDDPEAPPEPDEPDEPDEPPVPPEAAPPAPDPDPVPEAEESVPPAPLVVAFPPGTEPARTGAPRVGPVEAGPLEDHADRGEDLAQGATALGALRQGVVGERLLDVEGVTAVLARVRIGGHGRRFYVASEVAPSA